VTPDLSRSVKRNLIPNTVIREIENLIKTDKTQKLNSNSNTPTQETKA